MRILQAFSLFAVQVGDPLTASALRGELLKVAVAMLLLAFGLGALGVFFFRKKSRDWTLVFFGLFSALYGFRLLFSLRIVGAAFGQSRSFWTYAVWLITCVIVLPFELFLYQIADASLKRFLKWLIVAQAALSAILVLLTALRFDSGKLSFVNSMSVLATVVFAPIPFLLARRRARVRQPMTSEVRLFLIGFAVWLLFILQANLRTLGILTGWDIEFFGFFAFVCCLGYIAASRSFAKEELLVTIHKELEIARQIQSSTLPREVPQIPGLDVAARYIPMSAVAGDFYDFLVVDPRRVGILVADVTGHGVPAALIASMLKVAFAAQTENAEDPARVLSGLNRALCGKFEEHFVTAVYVFLDSQRGFMRYAGAGHPPLLVTSASNGAVHPFEENGLMLGLFPEAAYTSAEMPLRPGDRCLLYTDGLFEASNVAQEEFGKGRVGQFLQTHQHLPASQLAAALLEEVSRWSGHSAGRRQDDDITLLVVAVDN